MNKDIKIQYDNTRLECNNENVTIIGMDSRQDVVTIVIPIKDFKKIIGCYNILNKVETNENQN